MTVSYAPTWLTVPAGEFLMGSGPLADAAPYRNEMPQQRVELSAFVIGRMPVTNAQYRAFVQATGHPPPGHWPGGRMPADKAAHPVTYVDWHDAQAYCAWAGARLPSEAEWEKAARGDDGRLWPWGDDAPDATRCHFNGNVFGVSPAAQGTMAVGQYPRGASVCGALDLAGNVWEWTSSAYRPYPYDPGDGRENPASAARRVVRGGTYNHDARGVRCADRTGIEAGARDVYIGFRIAADAPRDGLDLVEVPAGEFLMGSDAQDEHAALQTVCLPEFRIAQTAVTNAEYTQFVAATGHATPAHWRGGAPPPGKEQHPVTYVDWHDAQAFCAWAGGRLPSEAEWEKAARGTDGRAYPWGDARPDATRLNFRRGTKRAATMPVGQYPAGASPYSALDMAGNVWEWVNSVYRPYPYDAGDGREDPASPEQRVLRGGSFASRSARYVRCDARSLSYPARRREHIGFRVAI
ncbi:MAG: SUMF1/EgtB/PvdO family nonheme iron enzyme [Chloroflexi bacterium]|nr:SUMF1/EgtB/PvdO family nonheme iron enzyme [Chloroflexota bacterium]